MEKSKHSKLGIASFIIGIASGYFMFLVIVIALLMGGEKADEEYAGRILHGGLLFTQAATFLAVGLSIGGLIQNKRKKIFAYLGAVFATLTCAGTIIIMTQFLAMS